MTYLLLEIYLENTDQFIRNKRKTLNPRNKLIR